MGMDDRDIAKMNAEPFFHAARICNRYAKETCELLSGLGIVDNESVCLVSFSGYTDGTTDLKTGFLIAHFPREIADLMCHETSRSAMYFDVVHDRYVYIDKDKKAERTHFQGEDIQVENSVGTRLEHAYPIGAGIWPWMELPEKWTVVTRYICPYCGDEVDEKTPKCSWCGRKVDV
jgi:hypothetical protein